MPYPLLKEAQNVRGTFVLRGPKRSGDKVSAKLTDEG